jgi:hypothetical protein
MGRKEFEDDLVAAISDSIAQTDATAREHRVAEFIDTDRTRVNQDDLRNMVAEAVSRIIINLTSGKELSAHQIMLYDEKKLIMIRALASEIVRTLGGTSAGLDTGAKPGRIIGGLSVQATLESLEGLGSRRRRKHAVQLAGSIPKMQRQLQDSRILFGIDQIANIDMPFPSRWYGIVSSNEVDEEKRGLFPKILGMKKLIPAHENKRQRYVHDGDDFILLKTESGFEYVRWSQVTSYRAEFAGT